MNKILELIIEWQGIQFSKDWWWLIPVILMVFAFFVSRFANVRLLLDKHSKARITDYANDKGPILEEKHKKNLLALHSTSSRKVMRARTRARSILRYVYNQKSLHTNGFERALLIAFFYPLIFILLTWLTNDKPLQLGEVIFIEPIPVGLKILLLIIPIVTFYWMKFAPSWISKKITTLSRKYSWVNNSVEKYAEEIGIFISIAIAFAFGFAVSAAIAIATAGAIAVAGAGAAAVSGALIGASAGAVAGAVAIAGAGALMVAAAVADAAVIVVVAAGAFIVVAAFFVVAVGVFERSWSVINKNSKQGFIKTLYSTFACFTYVVIIALCLINMPSWLNDYFDITFSETSFVIAFFLCLLPLVNGLSDWLSVSFTQFCLSRYTAKGGSNWVVLLFVDFCVALALTALLFLIIFFMLDLMQKAGWPVDSHAIQSQIYSDFKNASSSGEYVTVFWEHLWLFGLIITNLIPTCMHLMFFVKAHFVGFFSPIRCELDDLLMRARVIEAPAGKYQEDDFKWSAVEAEKAALYVAKLPAINALVFFSLIIPFLYLILFLSTSVIAWLVR